MKSVGVTIDFRNHLRPPPIRAIVLAKLGLFLAVSKL